MRNEARVTVAGAGVVLVGTIAGFVPDAARVKAAFAAATPQVLALGVPPEDVAALAALDANPAAELPEPDPQTQRLFALLAPHGECRVPSPDLEAAYRAAREQEITVVAIDMDDEAHSQVYIEKVGFVQAVRSGKVLRRLLEHEFKERDPYELALAWDAFQNQQRSLQAVEAAREAHMAARIRDVAKGRVSVLAVVPLARLAGVARHLS